MDYGVTFDNINKSAPNNWHCYSRYYKHRCVNDTIARYMNLNCCLWKIICYECNLILSLFTLVALNIHWLQCQTGLSFALALRRNPTSNSNAASNIVMFWVGDGSPIVTLRLTPFCRICNTERDNVICVTPSSLPSWTHALVRCRSETIIMLVELKH